MRPPALPADTSLDAHRVQNEIYAQMGGTARVAIAFRLTEMLGKVTCAGIRRRHPHYSDAQVTRAWARLRLGDALVRAVWPHHELVDP